MNEDRIAPMTPLDQMLAQDSLQMLKAAVPYFPADVQRVFALYAKMMELSHTIAMFSGGPAELMMMSEESGTSQPLDILQQLRTYAGESQKEMIDQMQHKQEYYYCAQKYGHAHHDTNPPECPTY